MVRLWIATAGGNGRGTLAGITGASTSIICHPNLHAGQMVGDGNKKVSQAEASPRMDWGWLTSKANPDSEVYFRSTLDCGRGRFSPEVRSRPSVRIRSAISAKNRRIGLSRPRQNCGISSRRVESRNPSFFNRFPLALRKQSQAKCLYVPPNGTKLTDKSLRKNR